MCVYIDVCIGSCAAMFGNVAVGLLAQNVFGRSSA